MPEHYTKNTLECTAWCSTCQRMTQHRVDGGRRGPCLECANKALYDFQFPAGTELLCRHCKKNFDPASPARLEGSHLAVKCFKCELITTFKVEPYMTAAQRARREKQKRAEQQPGLFGGKS